MARNSKLGPAASHHSLFGSATPVTQRFERAKGIVSKHEWLISGAFTLHAHYPPRLCSELAARVMTNFSGLRRILTETSNLGCLSRTDDSSVDRIGDYQRSSGNITGIR